MSRKSMFFLIASRTLMKLSILSVIGAFLHINLFYVVLLLIFFVLELGFLIVRKVMSRRDFSFLILTTSLISFLFFALAEKIYLVLFFVIVDLICLLSIFYKYFLAFGMFFIFSFLIFNFSGFIVTNSLKSIDVRKFLHYENINFAKGRKEGVELDKIIFRNGEYIKTMFSDGEEITLFVRALPYKKEYVLLLATLIFPLISLPIISGLGKIKNKKLIRSKDKSENSKESDDSKESDLNVPQDHIGSEDKIYFLSLLEEELNSFEKKISEDKSEIISLEEFLQYFENETLKLVPDLGLKDKIISVVERMKEVLFLKRDLSQFQVEISELKKIASDVLEKLKSSHRSVLNFKLKLENFERYITLLFRSLEYSFHEIFSPLGGIENEIGKIKILLSSDDREGGKIFKSYDIFVEIVGEFEKTLDSFLRDILSSLENIKVLAFNSQVLTYKVIDKARAFEPLASAVEELILVRMEEVYKGLKESYEKLKHSIGRIKDVKLGLDISVVNELEKDVISFKSEVESKISSVRSLISSNIEISRKTSEVLDKLSDYILQNINFFSEFISKLDQGLSAISSISEGTDEAEKFLSYVDKLLDELKAIK
ncbi:MAG: hypothetical protein RRA63_02540 [Candidatus Calescibacterium sp.]|nr:hypothetical protein [Candidatus Calescibacterium sp.]